MHTTLHLLWHDFRRLAPFVALYAAFLAWRVSSFNPETFYRTSYIRVQLLEMAAVLIVGLLVLDAPLFARRAFWRTRPISGGALLGARLLFVALALWLPRVLAQVASIRTLGLDSGAFWRLTVLDLLLAEAMWVAVALTLVSLCRRLVDLTITVLAAVFLVWPVHRLLRDPIWQETGISSFERHLAHSMLSAMLLAACGLALTGLYGRRWLRVAWAAPVALVGIFYPAQISAELAHLFTSINAPQGLEFDLVEPRSRRPTFEGLRPPLILGLEPRNLPPDLGLQVLDVKRRLRNTSGELRELQETSHSHCAYPEALLAEFPDLTSSIFDISWGSCSSHLEVPLFRPQGENFLSLEGTLELELTLRAFRIELQEVPIQLGATLDERSRTFVLKNIEEPPEGWAKGKIALHFSFFEMATARPTTTNARPTTTVSLKMSDFLLLDPVRRKLISSVGQRGGANSGFLHFALPYSRLRLGTSKLYFDPATLAAAGVEDIRSLHLVDWEPIWSEPFTVTVSIEGFRAIDHLPPVLPR